MRVKCYREGIMINNRGYFVNKTENNRRLLNGIKGINAYTYNIRFD